MFWNDEKTGSLFGKILLILLPVLYTAMGLWGGLFDVLLLVALLSMSRKNKGVTTAILLGAGYGIALMAFHLPGLEAMSFVPLAGFVVIGCWQRQLPPRTAVFWGLLAAGLLAALPLIYMPYIMDASTTQAYVDTVMKQYTDAGLMTAFQQQGITENTLKDIIAESLALIQQFTPGFFAANGVGVMGIAYFIHERLPWKYCKNVPFSQWRLPWYAIWGAIVGIILYLFGDQIDQPTMKITGQNIMMVYVMPVTILGISIYSYILKAVRLSTGMKWMLVIISVIFAPFSLMSSILFGLFDMVMNFRRLPDGLNDEPEEKD